MQGIGSLRPFRVSHFGRWEKSQNLGKKVWSTAYGDRSIRRDRLTNTTNQHQFFLYSMHVGSSEIFIWNSRVGCKRAWILYSIIFKLIFMF